VREKIKLGILTAVVALLALGLTAWAAPPPSGEADLADFDIYRTGTPDYDLVLRCCGEVGPLVLEQLRWAGGPRADGYYWLPIEENERDVVDDLIEELQQMMGEDFPIAVSVVETKPAPIGEAALAALEARVAEFLEARTYKIGTPNLDLVRELHKEYREWRLDLKYWPEFVATGYALDGYYELWMKDENWDAIHETVYELQQMMGDDFPVAVRIAPDIRRLGTAASADTEDGIAAATTESSDVFGGHWTTIQTALFEYDRQTLAFAAVYGSEVGMVLSGHYTNDTNKVIMPVGARVYSPTSYYPFRTNQIGEIHHVACQNSEASYMSPGWSGPGRIKAGVLSYGSHLPVWSYKEPEVGDLVYKTGRTTGTTFGEILWIGGLYGLCDGLMPDQCLAAAGASGGDSGAPVYSIEWVDTWPELYAAVGSGALEVAVLKGVVWAEVGGYCIFSPIGLVLYDLDVWALPGPFG